MNSNYNAKMSFRFVNGGNEYTYNGLKCEVSGSNLRDSIKYTPESVNLYLQNGQWKVVGDLLEFPRGGIHAKFNNDSKVFIVGLDSTGNKWVVENKANQFIRASAKDLAVIGTTDDQAFEISKDLGVSYYQAMQMIKKGYGKL